MARLIHVDKIGTRALGGLCLTKNFQFSDTNILIFYEEENFKNLAKEKKYYF